MSFQTAALQYLVYLRSGECCLTEKIVQSKNLKLATDLVGNGFTAVEQRQLSLEIGLLKPQLVQAEIIKSKAALHLRRELIQCQQGRTDCPQGLLIMNELSLSRGPSLIHKTLKKGGEILLKDHFALYSYQQQDRTIHAIELLKKC